jgi:hypothetical protein
MRRPAILALSLCVLAAVAWFWSTWRGAHHAERDGYTNPTRQRGSGPFDFTNIGPQSGLDFTYFRGETGKYWITETTGGGVALVDFDSDGWLDVVVVDGCAQPPDPADHTHPPRLFRNQRDGTFAEVTDLAGIAHSGYGQGCYGFDYDNDGFADLYLTYWGPNALLHNHGDGTYGWPDQPGRPATDAWSTGAVPGDFDRDGAIDLLVVNYLEFDPRNVPICGDPRTAVHSYCGPDSFAPTPSVLLRNLGDGSFEDVSRTAGIVLPDGSARPHAKGLGAVAGDFNGDGWLDIYVANDLEPNFLFLNRTADSGGVMRFEEAAVTQGAATSLDGVAQDSMGVASGDIDGDGRIDLLVTNFYLEGVTLYRNLGVQGFVDGTRAAGLLVPTRPVLGWGAGFFDFDNDGQLDLFTANGHVQSEPGPGISYAMPAQLFRNESGGRFREVLEGGGEYFDRVWNGRGAAFGDLDNDGDIDIVVVHHHQPMALLRNDAGNRNGWIRVTVVGKRSDRDAVGAHVRMIDPQSAVREVGAAGSYLSSNDIRLLFGLGTGSAPATIELRWPSGATRKLERIESRRDVVVYEP